VLICSVVTVSVLYCPSCSEILREYSEIQNFLQIPDTQYSFKPWTSKLLWQRTTSVIVSGLRAVRGKLTVSGIPNLPNNCVNFILHKSFTTFDAGRVLETHALTFRFISILQCELHSNNRRAQEFIWVHNVY